MVATNQPVAISNLIHQQTGFELDVPDMNNPVERELQRIMVMDDEAQQEVDKWIIENRRFAAEGAGVEPQVLNQRIRTRFEPVRKAYQEFIKKYPDNARGRIAYASFLNDLGEEGAVFEQLEKAKELSPNNAAVWNNLANIHGHTGEPKMAFEYYEKAININSNEPIYYHNFGTTVFLFRVDAREYYNIDEQQVFDKALNLYSNAMRLSPEDFALASDVAQTYYGIKPLRTNDALMAWTNAMNLAGNDVEREGVHIHFARIKMLAGQYDEAKSHLDRVHNRNYADLKVRVGKAIQNRIEEAGNTNAPASTNSNDILQIP